MFAIGHTSKDPVSATTFVSFLECAFSIACGQDSLCSFGWRTTASVALDAYQSLVEDMVFILWTADSQCHQPFTTMICTSLARECAGFENDVNTAICTIAMDVAICQLVVDARMWPMAVSQAQCC